MRRAATTRPWRIAVQVMTIAITVGILLLLFAVALLPRLAGGAAYAVLSGSMSPTINAGDLVAVRVVDPTTACEDVEIGQVITYFPEPNQPDLITHRVIGKLLGDPGQAPCELLTQGDANSAPDPPVLPEQVRGVVWYRLPWLGHVRNAVANHPVPAALAAAVIAATLPLPGGKRRPRPKPEAAPKTGGHDI